MRTQTPTSEQAQRLTNEPPEFRPLQGKERAMCLMMIGWSDATLARMLRISRNQVYRNRPITGEEAAWVRRLAAFHEANPPPRAVQRRITEQRERGGLKWE